MALVILVNDLHWEYNPVDSPGILSGFDSWPMIMVSFWTSCQDWISWHHFVVVPFLPERYV